MMNKDEFKRYEVLKQRIFILEEQIDYTFNEASKQKLSAELADLKAEQGRLLKR